MLSPSPKPWWRQDWFLALLLVAVTFFAYQPAWHGEPVYDDEDHLTAPELRSTEGLARIWTELGAVSQYYPVTHTAFWVQHRLWGDAMLGYHLVNILLHVLAALLLIRLLRRLEVPGAWLAAALFALHPVQVESVAWISELKNTLSLVFYLAAALAYLRFAASRPLPALPPPSSSLLAPGSPHPAPRSWLLYAAALALFVLGLLSKTVVASLPAALLVVFWWKHGTLSWRRDVAPLLPFFILGAAAGLFTAWVERTYIGAEGAAFELSAIERVLVAGRVVWFYLGKLVWPADLVFIYPRWQVSAAVAWQYLFPAAALLLLAGLWRLRRRARGPLAAALLFGGTLFPVLGFLNVYPFVYSYVADHYQYLATVGALSAAAIGLARLLERSGLWLRPAGLLLCLALPGALAVLTWRQSRIYTDVETLWRATLARNPASFVAHSNLSNFLLQTGRLDEAVHHGRRAVELRPDFAEVHNNLGNALREKGELDEALSHYRRAVEIRPDLAAGHYNLGAVLLSKNLGDEAVSAFQAALSLAPEFIKARNALGGLLVELGRPDEAAVHAREVIALSPDDIDAHITLANALLQKGGDPAEPLALLQTAVRLQPGLARAHTQLGGAYLQAGRVDDAIAAFENALKLRPDDADLHNDLGNALVQKGRLDDALARYRRALELHPDSALAHYNLGHVLFNQGRPAEAIPSLETAVGLRADFMQAHYFLGGALLQTGRPELAIPRFETALSLQPRVPQILNDLGVALIQNGRVEEALERFRAAVEIDPDFAEGHNNVGKILMQSGRVAEALVHYRASLKIQPDNPETLANLAWVLATSPDEATRNGVQAIYLAQRANKFSGGDDPYAVRTLAAALAEVGRYSEATAAARHALQLAETARIPDLAAALREQITLHAAGVPIRDRPANDSAAPPPPTP